jgi:hypothetical protein
MSNHRVSSEKHIGIVISTSKGFRNADTTKEILNGLEEEQVPYWIDSDILQTDDMVKMAYQAACRSVFGVGLCCSEKGVVIHHSKLKKNMPLFYCSGRCSSEKARQIGEDAARLVQGLPFNNI